MDVLGAFSGQIVVSLEDIKEEKKMFEYEDYVFNEANAIKLPKRSIVDAGFLRHDLEELNQGMTIEIYEFDEEYSINIKNMAKGGTAESALKTMKKSIGLRTVGAMKWFRKKVIQARSKVQSYCWHKGSKTCSKPIGQTSNQ